MKNLFVKIVGSVCLCLLVGQLSAQAPIRKDDYFWSKRVVNRIALGEKINYPMIAHQSDYYSGGQYTETQGIVVSLINGAKKGMYQAYHPENWEERMNYTDIEARMQEFDEALTGAPEWESESPEPFAYEDNNSEFSDEWESSGDSWSEEIPEEEVVDEWGGSGAPAEAPRQEESFEVDYAAYEEVIHMVEDWIFDRKTSTMVQQVDFFEVIWVDPTGVLPDKVLARFKYADVQDQLDRTMWKNRFNDAEIRSLKEVFELRLFNSFLINVGGEGVMTLQESERRKQELIEFEHHLWSY